MAAINDFIYNLTPRVILGQTVGFLGAHAVVALNISTKINPLATSLSMASYYTATQCMVKVCGKITESQTIRDIIANTCGFVAGAAVYTTVSARKDLLALSATVLCVTLGIKTLYEEFASMWKASGK